MLKITLNILPTAQQLVLNHLEHPNNPIATSKNYFEHLRNCIAMCCKPLKHSLATSNQYVKITQNNQATAWQHH